LGVEYITFPTLRGIPFCDKRQGVGLPAIRCCLCLTACYSGQCIKCIMTLIFDGLTLLLLTCMLCMEQ